MGLGSGPEARLAAGIGVGVGVGVGVCVGGGVDVGLFVGGSTKNCNVHAGAGKKGGKLVVCRDARHTYTPPPGLGSGLGSGCGARLRN